MQTPPHVKEKYDIVPRPTRVLYTSEQSHYHILPSSLQISTEFGTRESTVILSAYTCGVEWDERGTTLGLT